MLQLGVFEGRYLNECFSEFGSAFFVNARLAHNRIPDAVKYNLFGVKSRQALSDWNAAGWCREQDPRGWFQWYCRYYVGRRSEDDNRQIARHRAYARHSAQVKNAAIKADRLGDITLRPVQRQSLLQWSRNPFPELSDKDSKTLCWSLISK
jgi:hypothetical protein